MTPNYDDLASRFRALAHPVRLQILNMLRGGEVCVCHMEAAFGKRQAYISQQLIVLREAGLVETRKEGLKIFYRLVDPTTATLLDAALGLAAGDTLARIDTCPCPRCANVISEDSLTNRR